MGDSIVSSSYTWKAEGDGLRLTAVKHGCADKVAETSSAPSLEAVWLNLKA